MSSNIGRSNTNTFQQKYNTYRDRDRQRLAVWEYVICGFFFSHFTNAELSYTKKNDYTTLKYVVSASSNVSKPTVCLATWSTAS